MVSDLQLRTRRLVVVMSLAQGQTLSGQARFSYFFPPHTTSQKLEPAHHHLGRLLVASTSPAEEVK